MPYTSSYDWRYTTTPRDYQSLLSPGASGRIVRTAALSGGGVRLVCFFQCEANRDQHPAFDRRAAVPRGHEAPTAADGLDSGIVEHVEARRLGDLGALHETVDTHQHANRHGALLFV